MTIGKRVAALESKSASTGTSARVRAWLGHPLTVTEVEQAEREAGDPAPAVNWTKLSKEAREWLLG